MDMVVLPLTKVVRERVPYILRNSVIYIDQGDKVLPLFHSITSQHRRHRKYYELHGFNSHHQTFLLALLDCDIILEML